MDSNDGAIELEALTFARSSGITLRCLFLEHARSSRRQLVRPTCIYAARSLSRSTDLRDVPSLLFFLSLAHPVS